jgi:hypothetical protein
MDGVETVEREEERRQGKVEMMGERERRWKSWEYLY